MRALPLLITAVIAVSCRSSASDPPLVAVSPEPVPLPVPVPVAVADAGPVEPAPPPPPTTVTRLSPTGVAETCQLLVPFPFTPPDLATDPGTQRWFRPDDLRGVAKLCAMDLYAATTTEDTRAVGVCPKLYSHTPAFDLYDLSDARMSKKAFEERRCGRHRRRGVPKLAKIKVRVYGKEPESALLYFHFSRLLGNAGFVYPATHRTVARPEVVRVSRAAIAFIEKLSPRTTPLDGYQVLKSRHRKIGTGADVIPGSLAKNPRGEGHHYPFKYYPDRETIIKSPRDLRQQSYFKVVSDRDPIAKVLKLDPKRPRRYRKTLQALVHANDFTNLVVIDHLFNQRDRVGNLHSRKLAHYVDDDGHLRWSKSAVADHPEAVSLERLLLKDNDDGLLWDKLGGLNVTALLGELRHLDPLLYQRLQWLAGLMTDPASDELIRAYFVDTVHVRETTYQKVRGRVIALAERFERAVARGKLRLDLDLAAAIAGAPPLP